MYIKQTTTYIVNYQMDSNLTMDIKYLTVKIRVHVFYIHIDLKLS